jgi:hypothetical protein
VPPPLLSQKLRSLTYSSVYTDIISRFFKDLPGYRAEHRRFRSVLVISRSRSFMESFRKTWKSPSVSLVGTLPKGKVSSDTLLVFHLQNAKSAERLRSLPHEHRKNTFLISSSSKVRIEDKTSFLDVVETHSSHPQLGALTADALNRISTEISFESTPRQKESGLPPGPVASLPQKRVESLK